MPRYTPIIFDPSIEASLSDLVELNWKKNSLIARFIIPHDSKLLLEIYFERVELIRIVDEMAIATEFENTENDGLIANHLAYSVENASFWNNQSNAFREVNSNATHYRLITGWTCVDIISISLPVFGVSNIIQ